MITISLLKRYLSHLDRNRNKARHEHLNRSALVPLLSLRLRDRRQAWNPQDNQVTHSWRKSPKKARKVLITRRSHCICNGTFKLKHSPSRLYKNDRTHLPTQIFLTRVRIFQTKTSQSQNTCNIWSNAHKDGSTFYSFSFSANMQRKMTKCEE